MIGYMLSKTAVLRYFQTHHDMNITTEETHHDVNITTEEIHRLLNESVIA